MVRSCAVGVLVGLLSASALMAKPGAVQTLQGDWYDGDVTEAKDGASVTVKTPAGPVEIKRQNVRGGIIYYRNDQEEFLGRFGHLKPNDAAGQLALIRAVSAVTQISRLRFVLIGGLTARA